MRNLFLIVILLIFTGSVFGYESKTDSLLKVLDDVISKHSYYADIRKDKIDGLKKRKKQLNDLNEIININREIIEQYNSFICDSAEFYIHENLSLARQLNREDVVVENKLRLSYIYSLSGLFMQASEIFDQLNYNELSDSYKVFYCWNSIRYYESLIFYTADNRHSIQFEKEKEEYRNRAMELLDEDSEEYKKELAHKLQQNGNFTEAEKLLLQVFHDQEPETHKYAMAAMNLAKLYARSGKEVEENNYLITAAIYDIKLAVKENEALLSLAINLFENGDVDRSYEYIRIALDDALFYNARFKNSVIARVQPIIEDTYLQKIQSQQKNLRSYSIVTSLFALVLIIILFYLYIQVKAVSKAKKELRLMNEDLSQLNRKLDEANKVKEHYIGYFMNQCSVYINKLHKYRKNVKLNIKAGQISNLFNLSNDELESDLAELYSNFDKIFMVLYPDFVSEFNSLLRPEEQYILERGELNNELRIFALIKLGIVDMKQIADFLHYSVQTVYNYKSKVKGKAINGGDQFEELIYKIGGIS